MVFESVKVLIVEDEALIATELKESLERMGVEVVDICGSGEEAIEMSKKKDYDFVFMDIVLSGKIDGIEAAEYIKKITDAGIIFITSYGFKDTVQKAKYIEPYSFIVKPYQKRDIYNALEIAIQKRNTDLKIRNQKRFLNSILSNINAGIIAVDKRGKVEYINKYAKEFWNLENVSFEDFNLELFYNVKDLSALNFENISLAEIIALAREKYAGDQIKVAYLNEKSYKIIKEKNFFFYDDEKQKEIKIIYFEDITKTLQQERELNKAKKFYLDILEEAQAIIWMTDEKGEFIYFNQYAKRYLNAENTTLKDLLLNVAHPEDICKYLDSFYDAVAKKNKHNGEFRIVNFENEVRYIYASSSPIWDYNSNFLGYLGIGFDITDIKLAQEEIIKAKEKAEKAEATQRAILANFSHEMRTPLTGIFGIADLLYDREKDPQKIEMIKILKDSAHKLLANLNNIIDLAKQTEGDSELVFEEVNLKEIISKICDFFKPHVKDKNLNIICQIDESLEPSFYGNAYGYTKVLHNIVDNAIKYTSKGTITIKVEKEESDENLIFIRTEVQDTGIGIDLKDLDKVFDPFYQAEKYNTRKFGGLGIGLTLAKKIVEKNGGWIKAESEPGKGTRIIFEMKFAKNLDKIKKRIT